MNRFQRYLSEEFAEEYEEGRISRREALHLIASVTGSAIVATSILAACTPPEQSPEPPTEPDAPPTGEGPEHGTVSPSDPGIVAGPVEFPGEGATIMAYLARPAAEGAFPVVLVCHENRGLTGHIEDVARRLANAGYAALAVDLLSRQGGTDAVGSGNVPGALGSSDPEQFVQDFLSGWRFLQGQGYAQADRVGMVGSCFGGGVTWLVATRMPELDAAVPFYGPPPPVDDVPAIEAPVLAVYAEGDQRINQSIPTIEEAMAANDKVYEKVVYPGTNHAFFNDTGSRYASEAAAHAWSRTLEWFDRYL